MSEILSNTARLRKCCPSCGSIDIARRTRKGGYNCVYCGFNFFQPAQKLTQPNKTDTYTIKKVKTRIINLKKESQKVLWRGD